jgi:hypothetical protein
VRWRRPKRTDEGLQEAKEALLESKQTNESIARKEDASRSIFRRIEELRQRNHIAEAVRDIMEAR